MWPPRPREILRSTRPVKPIQAVHISRPQLLHLFGLDENNLSHNQCVCIAACLASMEVVAALCDDIESIREEIKDCGPAGHKTPAAGWNAAVSHYAQIYREENNEQRETLMAVI